jgi:hypothetical protein
LFIKRSENRSEKSPALLLVHLPWSGSRIQGA